MTKTNLEFKKTIELKGVYFRYASATIDAVKDVSIKIPKGDSVGFIGQSGSGKSTLIDIILGLLTPSVGQIFVDGKNIHGDLRSWQNQLGYVPQSIYLTDDTLRRNIAFGLPNEEIDEAAVKDAINAAQLDLFIDSLAEGLDTIVGERGIRLSGGQRQRIGIARALYHNPDVLVLDEATSALDTVTERGVMEALKAMKGVRTIIIVAHRLSTVEDCDKVYRLINGRIVLEESPIEIIKNKNFH